MKVFKGIIFPIVVLMTTIVLTSMKGVEIEGKPISAEELYRNQKCSSSVVNEYVIERAYSDDDVALLAHIINAEQGIEFDDEEKTNKLQIYAGKVVLNRMEQKYRGASSIEEVLYTPGQYACISDCSWDNPVSERAYKNAELLLSGAEYWEIYDIPKMPDDVIFQAEFTQGSGTWLQVGDTYFCYK